MLTKITYDELPEQIRVAYPREVWNYEFIGAERYSGGMFIRLNFHTTSQWWHLDIHDDSGSGEWHQTDIGP